MPNAVIVLDGASQPDTTERDGGWMAEKLGSRIASRLLEADEYQDLTSIVAGAIADNIAYYNLVPGDAPSTTVSIVRWRGDDVEAFVLGDSPIIASTNGGQVFELRDDRLSKIAPRERHALRESGGFGFEHHQQWRNLVAEQRRKRNRPDGYWIAEAVPEAATHARHRTWCADELTAVMVMTDGVSVGVDKYGIPADWCSAFALACQDPAELIRLVHDVENNDVDGARWPRNKLHDDKALAVIEFLSPDSLT